MTTLDYPIVSTKNPILTIYVSGVDLTKIVSVGENALYIRRIGDVEEFVKYLPFEERPNQFLFAFDALLFIRAGGRFEGRLVYKGVTIQTIDFIYKPDRTTLVGVTDV